MPTYRAPLEDIRFVLDEVVGAARLADLPGHEDATPDLISAVLEEGARFAENELQPLNRSGDREGCTFENGVVRTPEGFREAYRGYAEGGWTGITADPDYGGQGLPHLVGFVMEEIVSSANMAFGMYPGLSHGAYNALDAYGSAEQKALYLPKLAAGTWSGTMCLTEAQCGTDLGLIRTKAVPNDDGSFALTGTKIFISAGEHDLTENIVHLVLARLPDAPPGIKGISLFVVPKFLPKAQDGDWVPGPRNGVACGSIEEKMGIHASATCVMHFDQATGWLVGEPHKGMRAMFVMMNAARLGVGLQGLGIGEVAYQNALAYAKDRRQGRALKGPAEPDQPADPILVHPDVRRTLLSIKAVTEGSRALAYWVGLSIDLYSRHPDAAVRQEAHDFVSLMTPIVKAYFTDTGFENANKALQVLGGHGYIAEWGMEQFVRDARIAQIYEGTNGIQALDLVGRKMPEGTGRLLRRFFHPVDAYIRDRMDDPRLQEFVLPLAKAFGKLQQATAAIAQKSLKNRDEAGAAASEYLRLFALVALAYLWARMAEVALDRAPEANGRADFYAAKISTARFFFARVLPEANGLFIAVMAGAETVMAPGEDAF
jgi:alkylation response protein AidB-like acyl-CoA dehydrogenase